jgi:hypothetical protein
MQDPNPNVSGQGFARLRAAGVTVDSGILEEEAKALNEAFTQFIRKHIPLVTLKAAMTLDGKIAPPPGESRNPTALGSGAEEQWIHHRDVARRMCTTPSERCDPGRCWNRDFGLTALTDHAAGARETGRCCG